MANDNPNKSLRNVYKSSNKYQDQIILLSFIPFIVMSLTFSFIALMGNPIIRLTVFHGTFLSTAKQITGFSLAIVLLMCSLLLVWMIGTFIVSNNMVGAFSRIIRELDEIIAGRSKKIITSRPKDGLTKDLLSRINVLAKFYIENKKNDT